MSWAVSDDELLRSLSELATALLAKDRPIVTETAAARRQRLAAAPQPDEHEGLVLKAEDTFDNLGRALNRVVGPNRRQ